MIPVIIKKQLSSGNLPHAYLFAGLDEHSKSETVEAIAEKILGVEWKRSLDYHEIVGEPITIDDIRAFKSEAYSSPISGEKNVFVIRDMENLSRDAFPALLKILEDPPASALIMATTKNLKNLLPTIRSRFSVLRFYKKEEDEFLGKLEKKARNEPNSFNLRCFEEGIWAKEALASDKTVNKRLLNEFLTMLAI